MSSVPGSPSPTPQRSLTVMRAHLAKDCLDRENCWAADIHDEYDQLRQGRTPRRRSSDG